MDYLNLVVQNYFVSTRTPNMTEFFVILTGIFDFSLIFFLIISVLFYVIYKQKGLKYSLLFVSTIFSTVYIVYVLKNIFDTTRPFEGVIYAYGGSFPSYHATMATVFFILLMYIFDDYFSKFFRIVFNTLSILGLFLVVLSRLYLGVHWLSDVVFGVLLGLMISYASIRLFKKYEYSL